MLDDPLYHIVKLIGEEPLDHVMNNVGNNVSTVFLPRNQINLLVLLLSVH